MGTRAGESRHTDRQARPDGRSADTLAASRAPAGLHPGARMGSIARINVRQDRPDPQPPADVNLAVLARAIEHEIIPRLMLAHRTDTECAIEPLTPPGGPVSAVQQQDVETLVRLVLARDSEEAAQACLLALRARGVPVDAMYVDLMAPVARRLGQMWELDLCDFTEVTMGLGRLQQLLREFSPAFGQQGERPSNGRRVLLTPAPGEQHTFGLAMVAEFFRHEGWDVAGGPMELGVAPAELARAEWFDVVGFSLSAQHHVDRLAQIIRHVRSASLNPRVCIMVGGPAFASQPDFVARVQADFMAGDGRQAPGLALSHVMARAQPA